MEKTKSVKKQAKEVAIEKTVAKKEEELVFYRSEINSILRSLGELKLKDTIGIFNILNGAIVRNQENEDKKE